MYSITHQNETSFSIITLYFLEGLVILTTLIYALEIPFKVTISFKNYNFTISLEREIN